MSMPTTQQTRTALLGLDRFFKKKPAPAQAPAKPQQPTKPSSPNRFQVTEKDAVKGAYFWVPAETKAYDVTGRDYPEKIRKNVHVEATGNVKNDRAEVRYNKSRMWVNLADLRKPLQSKKAATPKVAAQGPEAAYAKASTLNELFRILLEGETGQSLKTTGKTKAAIKAMQDILETECKDCTYGDGGIVDYANTMVPASMGQKAAFAKVVELVKNRAAVAAEIANARTKSKATAHVADLFILAAALNAVKAKGDTKARAKFLFDHVPQIVLRAGGSSLQTKFVNAIRKAIPWKDATKMRQQRGLEASTKKTAALNDLDVINAFSVPRPLPTTGTYHDLVFDWLRKNGPERGWLEMHKPEDALIVLTAAPRSSASKAPRLELSKQVVSFIADVHDRLSKDHGFDRVYAPQAENATLADLLAGLTTTTKAMELATLVTHSTWYGQLVVDGRPNGSMLAAYALYALAHFRVAMLATDDTVRATAFISGVSALIRFRLMQPQVALARLRSFFPWTVVSAMLRHRMG